MSFNMTNPIFFDAEKAREHLEAVNWPEGPFCPHCGETDNVTRLQGKSHRPGLIQCNSCAGNFTVTVGTVFERSKIPLNKWMLATYLLASSKKGMSAHQLHRMLGVTYKTAWFMMHRIREAMQNVSDSPDSLLAAGPVRPRRIVPRVKKGGSPGTVVRTPRLETKRGEPAPLPPRRWMQKLEVESAPPRSDRQRAGPDEESPPPEPEPTG